MDHSSLFSKTVSIVNLQTWDEAFEAHVRRSLKSKRSQAQAIGHVRLFAAWYEAQFQRPFDAQAITNYAVHQYRHFTLNEQRLAANTWNSRWWALNMLCEWAGCASAMAGVTQKTSASRSELHRRLTSQEYNRLHEALERNIRGSKPGTFELRDFTRDRAAVMCMLEGGMRVDEVHQLDVTDITVQERSLTLRIRSGKGDKERKTYLKGLPRQALLDWLAMHDGSTSALFYGKSAERLTTRSLQRIVEYLRADSNIPDLRCHSLRFDFAKRCEDRLVAQGKGRNEVIRTLMALLGHESSTTTERYLYSSADDLLSAVGGE